jgi:hypothetical protein
LSIFSSIPDILFSTCSTLFAKLQLRFLFRILSCLFWVDYFSGFSHVYWFTLSYPG